ncbi:MAG: TetR/AcrR family transcriptional regulator [Actinomycetota bacterium]
MARPRKFDEAEVLACAMTEFWRNGYHATTTRTLEAQTGVGIRSLANTFGDKDQLFVSALARYRETAAGMLNQLFDPPSVDAIAALFGGMSAPVDPDHVTNSGCLMVNTVFELDEPPEAVAAEIAAYRAMFRDTFEAALRADGVPDPDTKAEFLLSSLWGALSQIRLSGSTTAAAPTVETVQQILATWAEG